ncbi:MAG: holo-ACP synthase [Rickettsiales bacterium]|jgi:holo-[acyl-carrier protein] synthase
MIYGIGVDIVEIKRITKLYDKFADKFVRKLLSDLELQRFSQLESNLKKNSFLAKRYAAKEALAKALGTGFRGDLTLNKISVINNDIGKPEILLAKELSNNLPDELKFFISLSDEKQYAIAYVIIENN